MNLLPVVSIHPKGNLHNRYLFILILFLVLTNGIPREVMAQKEFTLLQYLEKCMTDKDFKMDIANTLVLDGVDVAKVLREKGYAVDDSNRVIIDAPIFIRDASVRGNTYEYNGAEERYDHLFLDGLHFKSTFQISLSGFNSFEISNCTFDGAYAIQLKSDRMMFDFQNNHMRGAGSLRIENGLVTIANNNFEFNASNGASRTVTALQGVPRALIHTIADSLATQYNNVYRPTDQYENLRFTCRSCDFFSFDNNQLASSLKNYVSYLDVRAQTFSFSNNIGNCSFQLSGAIEKEFTLHKNLIDGYYLFDSFSYPEDALVEWTDIDGKVAIPSSMYGRTFVTKEKDTLDIYVSTIYTGTNKNDDVLSKDEFNNLLFTYKLIHSTYVKRGNLEDANNCFVAIKDLEAQKLNARVAANPSFKNWIRYKLNRLMKFYTNHGTDPGLAIQISIYLILVFSLIYFFFPSDWDTKPKAALWEKLRALRQERGKRLIKSTFSWLYMLLLMFLNSFTLSLNVFVTLGFGNIPTHGVARHLCIIQGFLGWFLLSLFSVALINQILF